MLTISPVAFLTFLRPRMKYQYRDLATTSLGAKIRMRYRDGVGLVSVGRCLPMTWYSWRRPDRSHVSKPAQSSRVKSVENVKSGSGSRVRELARVVVVFDYLSSTGRIRSKAQSNSWAFAHLSRIDITSVRCRYLYKRSVGVVLSWLPSFVPALYVPSSSLWHRMLSLILVAVAVPRFRPRLRSQISLQRYGINAYPSAQLMSV